MAIRRIDQGKFEHRHQHDIERMQRVCRVNGYDAGLKDLAEIWDEYSYMFSAGWLGLPSSDDELWQILESKIQSFGYINK